MKKTLEFQHWLGDLVYRKIDNTKGYIVGMNIRPGGSFPESYAIAYVVSLSNETEMYWGFEIDSEPTYNADSED